MLVASLISAAARNRLILPSARTPDVVIDVLYGLPTPQSNMDQLGHIPQDSGAWLWRNGMQWNRMCLGATMFHH